MLLRLTHEGQTEKTRSNELELHGSVKPRESDSTHDSIFLTARRS
jgi:hypothetical protein